MNFHRKYLRAACISLCAGYLIVGLWPFDFFPRNYAGWLPDPGGVQFTKQSIVYSERVLEGTDALTVEFLLRADTEPSHDIRPILSLYDGMLPENLFLAQWRSALLVRLPVWNREGRRGYREIGAGGALRQGLIRSLAVTTGTAGT